MIVSIIGATASHIVLTAFAPIASLQSTCNSAINIGPTLESIILTVSFFAPPPKEHNTGSCAFALSRICFSASNTFILAISGFLIPTVWICPIIIELVLLV